MDWLKKFMLGRYGSDQLSMGLLVLSVLLTWIAGLTRVKLLTYVGYIPLFISFYRILSRDIQKRSLENNKFNRAMKPVYSWFQKTMYLLQESKTHKRFKCPSCKASLRVPKGKREIIITCPKCRAEFRKRT